MSFVYRMAAPGLDHVLGYREMSGFSSPESALLDVGGFQLHVDRWPGGGNAHVLLLHGLGGNSITWHGVAPLLARELGAHVVAFDMPGFGASRPAKRSVNLRVLADAVLG